MAHSYKLFDTPGLLSRCDLSSACIPYASRDQTSFDFLCCEDRAWVAAHVMNPLAVGMFFGWKAAIIAAFWFEVYEITVLLFFDSFIISTTTDLDRETLAGSVLGDAFCNGTLGAILSYQICELARFVPPFQRWSNMKDNWHRAKYVLLFVLFELCFECAGLASFAEPAILFSVFAFFLYLVLVYSPLTNFAADVRLVWRGESGVAARNTVFLLYVIVAAILYSQNAGLKYFANDWYQVHSRV